jgi:hypothetical protein
MERRRFLQMCCATGLCAALLPGARGQTANEGAATMADLKYVT